MDIKSAIKFGNQESANWSKIEEHKFENPKKSIWFEFYWLQLRRFVYEKQ